MFGIGKEELLTNLENLRKSLCCYEGDFCDCKYGIYQPSTFGSELNGCPEIRQAMAIINSLTNEEFDDICKRARVITNLFT